MAAHVLLPAVAGQNKKGGDRICARVLFSTNFLERYATMQFRSITPAEMAAFSAIPGDASRRAAIEEQLRGLIESSNGNPDWMWIAEDDEGQWVGRVAYSGNRGESFPSYVVWLDVDPRDDEMNIASDLTRVSLTQLRVPELREVEAILDAPSAFAGDPDRFAVLLSAAGFHLVVDRRRFAWTPEAPIPPAPTRVIFQTLTEVGDEAFIATMARITEGTLDHYTQELVGTVGRIEAARRHFHDEQRFQRHWESHWWQVGLLPTGETVGVVMPAENSRWPNIGYIGVVPDQRGHGYSMDLLAQGTRTLIAEGAKRIIADTDLDNTPMANAFLSMGYRQFATRQFWKLTFDAEPPESR